MYVSTHLWCTGNALCVSAPGFNTRFRQGFFYVWCVFCCCCCCVFTFLFKNTLFVTKFCNIFCNVNLLGILNILQDLWPIIRVEKYSPSIFKCVSIIVFHEMWCFFETSGTCTRSITDRAWRLSRWTCLPGSNLIWSLVSLTSRSPRRRKSRTRKPSSSTTMRYAAQNNSLRRKPAILCSATSLICLIVVYLAKVPFKELGSLTYNVCTANQKNILQRAWKFYNCYKI